MMEFNAVQIDTFYHCLLQKQFVFIFTNFEIFPFAHNSKTSMQVSLQLLSFEEIGYTVATRHSCSFLFTAKKFISPIIEGKYLNICRTVSWVPIMQLDVSPEP